MQAKDLRGLVDWCGAQRKATVKNKMAVTKTSSDGVFCLVIDLGYVEAYPEGRVKM